MRRGAGRSRGGRSHGQQIPTQALSAVGTWRSEEKGTRISDPVRTQILPREPPELPLHLWPS